MPRYKIDRRDIVRDQEAKELVDGLIDPRDRAMVCFFYIFGCRPSELIKIKPDDFEVKDGKVYVTISTAKKRKGKSPITDPVRQLWWPADDYFMKILMDYVNLCDFGTPIWQYGGNAKSASVIMNRRIKAVNPNICLYVFRHSRNGQFDEAGATNSHFVYWNGWADERPRKNYRHITKQIVDSMPVKAVNFDEPQKQDGQ